MKSFFKVNVYLFGFLLIIISPQSFAQDEGRWVLSLGLLGNSQSKQVSEDSLKDEFNVGLAALVEVMVRERIGIETGALLVERQYDVSSGSLRLIQSARRLHIPVLARWWVADYFALGLGPYAAVRLGSVRNAVQFGEAELALDTSSRRDLELGFDVSALLNLAIHNRTGLFLEGRYSSPFDRRGGEESSHIFGIVGVKLHLY